MKIKKYDNGLTLLCDTNKKCNIISMVYGFKVGSCNELERKNFGISHILEHMMFKGTKTRTYQEINEEVDFLGGDINAQTSGYSTMYYINAKKDVSEKCFEILSDMVFNSIFPEEELEKEKNVILQELKMYKDDPSSYVEELHQAVSFKNEEYSHPIIGYEDTIRNVSREDLIEYKNHFYQPNNTIISFSGNITLEECEKLIEKYYVPSENKYEIKLTKPKYILGKDVKFEGRQEQDNIILSYGAYKDKDIPTSIILNGILGNGMSSKLFTEIREKRGLVYGIGSYSNRYNDINVECISLALEKSKKQEALDAIQNVLQEIMDGNFSDRELQKIINCIETSIIVEDNSLVHNAIKNISYYLKFKKARKPKEALKKIKKVTKNDIILLSKKLFCGKMNIVDLSPIGKE